MQKAAGSVTFPNLKGGRPVFMTDCHRIAASVFEGASRNLRMEVRRRSLDTDQRLLVFLVRLGNAAQKAPSIRMGGMIKKVFTVTAFHDAAGVHDHDSVRHLRNNAQVVGNEQNRCVQLLLQIFHQFQDLQPES